MARTGLISVVTPMHNEEGNARAMYERTAAAMEGLEWELVVVDDGSKDATLAILEEIAAADQRVKLVKLSRNFGHQAAITAGLEHATGEAVVMIDADLQDPPEVIPDMVKAWQGGSDVVYGVRASREGETKMKLLTAHLFYRMMARLAQIDLPLDSGDFRLMDRRALEVLLNMPERNRFLRGMTVWIGFTQTALPYKRDARVAGETKFTMRKMLRFSFDAISSFSYFPLQLATFLGFAVSILAFIAIPVTVIARINDIFVPGISSTLIAILLLGGIQLITLGVVGEYVGRIYDEVKRRPLYVIKETQNIDHDDEQVGPRHPAGTDAL
jgi:glycosyltransferase involved in cell wall biosynthesis